MSSRRVRGAADLHAAVRVGLAVTALGTFLFLAPAGAQVSVLTQHNDNARTGQNLLETVLTPDTVRSSQFGRLFQYPVDGDVYTQPLYVAAVAIPGVGVRNMVYIATEHDSVYAFDADDTEGTRAPLWQDSFIDLAAGVTAVPYADTATTDIAPEIGITGTPVIDPTTGTLYVVAKTKEPSAYAQRLHALDIATGAEKFGGPVLIAPEAAGGGDGNTNGVLTFDALRENQRAGLLLLNGVVYITWASHGDHPPYHGWVVGYDAQTLQPVAVFNDTPDGSAGGIWQGGGGLSADDDGTIYCATGNGTVDGYLGGRDFGESVLRLSTADGLRVADYFTPFNYVTLNGGDFDLGSSGVLLLPDQPAARPHLAVTAGKQGTIYIVDRDDLGQFHAGDDSQIVQSLPSSISAAFGTAAYWNGTVYFAGENDFPKAFRLSAGHLSATPVSQGTTSFGFPGGSPSVSANGTSQGIVWVLQTDAYGTAGPAVLWAYDATNLANVLYQSTATAGPTDAGRALKFAVPTIANGKVYVPGRHTLTVFGLTLAMGTATARPTVTAPPTPRATRTPGAAPSDCPGDCNGDGRVTIDELVEGAHIALGMATLNVCPAFDCKGNAQAAVDCLVEAVDEALHGCPALKGS